MDKKWAGLGKELFTSADNYHLEIAPAFAAEAMELGADAVLVNTAIAIASDPEKMARAFKQAVQAGRTAFELGLPQPSDTAHPTSPLTAFLNQ